MSPWLLSWKTAVVGLGEDGLECWRSEQRSNTKRRAQKRRTKRTKDREVKVMPKKEKKDRDNRTRPTCVPCSWSVHGWLEVGGGGGRERGRAGGNKAGGRGPAHAEGPTGPELRVGLVEAPPGRQLQPLHRCKAWKARQRCTALALALSGRACCRHCTAPEHGVTETIARGHCLY